MTTEKNMGTTPKTKLKMTIGLAAKAGKTVFGTPLICESLRAKGAKKCTLVLEGADSSENTHKKLSDKCAFYDAALVRLPITMSELSDAVGKRSTIAAVGITDEGLAKAIMKKLEDLPSQM